MTPGQKLICRSAYPLEQIGEEKMYWDAGHELHLLFE